LQNDLTEAAMDKELDEFDLDATEVMRLLETCPVCANRLHFTHFSDFSRLVAFEVVRCDECGYKVKKQMTRLQ
jgi:C4-type Zn-finger protein